MNTTRRIWACVLASLAPVAMAAGADRRSSHAIPTTQDELKAAVREAPLRLMFKGASATELRTWQDDFAARLRAAIGPYSPPDRWRVSEVNTTTFADHVREELLLTAEGGLALPLYLLRPRTPVSPRLPVVLALHGHGPFGHTPVAGVDDTPERAEDIRKANYDYGRQLARQGYLVVAPCFKPFGVRLDEPSREGRTDPCAVTFVRLSFLGRTLVGDNLRDALWALNYAAKRPDARGDRLGCVGLSLGGRMTMIVAALDPRIRVAVISGALNVFQERAARNGYGCGAQAIPGLLEIGDTPEIGSLIAPRPAIWEVGSKDGLIDKAWAERAKERIRHAYQAAGQPQRVQFHHFEGGHQWSGTTAVEWLARELKGE